MKAWTATGDPAHALEFTEAAEPLTAPDEIVVAVDAFSVNRGEVFALTGVYGTPAERGWRPGQDIAGRVVRAAADGSGPASGQRVVAHPDGGGWAERVAVATSRVAVLPDGVSAVTAASLPLAGLTALRLVREAGATAGASILITGASGGVGHYAVELAARSGAQITAVAASAERGRRLAELGAAHVVEDVGDAQGPFDVVLESVGGETFNRALSRLVPAGTLVWFGQASLEPVTLNFFDLFGITPVTIKHFPHWVSSTSDGDDLATLVSLVATDMLHPEIGRVADWAETATVLDDLDHRRVRGNAVLTVTAP